MFALLTGLLNFSAFISPQLGNLANRFFGVNQSNLGDLWKLILIQACCSLLPLLFVRLIPTKAEIDSVQKVLEYDHLRKQKVNSTDDDLVADWERLDPNVALRMGVVNLKANCLRTVIN